MVITKIESKILYWVGFFTTILFGIVGALVLFAVSMIYFCGKMYLQNKGSVSELPSSVLRKKQSHG